jgi:sugar phosphate isomerase/epimerase
VYDERIAVGLPSLAGYSLPEALSAARRLGFQSVMVFPDGPRARHSLGAFPTLSYYSWTEEQGQAIADSLGDFRHIAIHQAWDDQWRRWIDCAARIGAETLTVHSGRRDESQTSSNFIADRVAQLRCLGDYAADSGVRIGVENEGGTCDDYLGLLAAIDHSAVGATLDLGHCAFFQRVRAVSDPEQRVEALNQTISLVVRALGKDLRSIHAHDVRQSDWRDHRCVGSGVIDFSGLFADLRQIGYSGLFELELEEPEIEAAAAATGERLTSLCRTMLADAGSSQPEATGG